MRFRLVIIASLAGCAPLNAMAGTLSGKDLLDACEAADAARNAFCLGYIRGVTEVDASRQATSVSNWMACLPPESATAALVNATARWIHTHPDMQVSSAAISVEMAVRSAFPCH